MLNQYVLLQFCPSVRPFVTLVLLYRNGYKKYHQTFSSLRSRVLLFFLQETSSVAAGFGRHGCPRPPLTLTFDRLALKLVCESHLRW